jgi:RNA polymerase sigma factor (TIGR02999 family)
MSQSTTQHELTGLLRAWCAGDEKALEKLTPLVYAELHRAANRYMAGERTQHTLQTTALINEVYLRLGDFQHVDWQNRAQFFGICAQLMRRILVDFARSHRSQKRGAGAPALQLDEALVVANGKPTGLLELDKALDELAKKDNRKCRIVELRFFAGLTAKETAHVLNVSVETVLRDWRLAKAWLLHHLQGRRPDEA